jgi:L-amino acid N-acyltransferase YncA
MMQIRQASFQDLTSIIKLSYQRSVLYDHPKPELWSKAAGNYKSLGEYFSKLLDDHQNMAFVAEKDHGELAGFILGQLVQGPPFYESTGYTCFVDDFCLAVGKKLLNQLINAVCLQGASHLVISAPFHNDHKKSFFKDERLAPVSEWHYKSLLDQSGN